MANRVAGLIGPGKGPWIHTNELPGLRVKICGLEDGVVTVVTLDKEYRFTRNGVFPIDDAIRCKVEYVGQDRGMVCTFLSGAAHAVR